MQPVRKVRTSVLMVLAAAALAVCQSTIPAKDKAPAKKNEILAALKTGCCVVVVVQPSRKVSSGEAYADWAEYLNDFASREKSVKIVKITQQRYAELVTAPKLGRLYSTLFVRDAHNALLYRGMILEPDVYTTGKAYMTARSGAAPVRRDGLEEVKLEMRP